MKTFIRHLLLISCLVFVTPATSHAAISLQDQRDAVYDALTDVISALEAEILDAQTTLAGLTPGSVDALQLSRQILILNSRLRFVEATQLNVRYFSQVLLNQIIIRFDLPVSPS